MNDKQGKNPLKYLWKPNRGILISHITSKQKTMQAVKHLRNQFPTDKAKLLNSLEIKIT